MSTLTTAYTDAVAARVPEAGREEIAREVAAMIEEMVEARLEQAGPDHDEPEHAAVEREVLEELGDPARLAREYARTPQHLIGPDWYPVFLWCVRWILPLAGVCALVANGVVYAATEPEPHLGGLIGATLGEAIGAVLTAFAAVTLLLAVVERTTAPEAAPGNRRKWTVEMLQGRAPSGSTVRADATVSLVLLALLAALPFVPTTFLYVGHLNNGETFVNPELGAGWLAGYWALLALLAVTEAWKAVQARLTPANAFTGIAVDAVLTAFLTVALLTQPVLHPALDGDGLFDTQLLTLAGVWVIFAWDLIATLRALRSQRRC
ncbi:MULTISPECIES: HAAS signaling domain-containing protein [Brevibacterium]|uniref:Permease prefix domain 1-containing protein n=1 Tax=Brevibacterium salitolerans TaxID=1403566 RepID=A0ABP5IHJ2_9MICO|nr:hypothetical protein [Brevibacterium sp.]